MKFYRNASFAAFKPERQPAPRARQSLSKTTVLLPQEIFRAPKPLLRFFSNSETKSINAKHSPRIERLLDRLETATQPEDMQLLVEGDYSASLDGLTFDGSLIVEIKRPVKGTDCRVHAGHVIGDTSI